MNCFKILNLSPTDLISDFNIIPKPATEKPYGVSKINPKLFLKDSFFIKLSELGDLSCLVFQQKGFADKKSIHIDIKSNGEPYYASLNIIIDGQGTMMWFSPSDEGTLHINNDTGVAYRAWFKNFGKPIDIWKEGKVALVKTHIPHGVWNLSYETRLIVSLRWSNTYSWDYLSEWFDKNLIL